MKMPLLKWILTGLVLASPTLTQAEERPVSSSYTGTGPDWGGGSRENGFPGEGFLPVTEQRCRLECAPPESSEGGCPGGRYGVCCHQVCDDSGN